VLGYSEPERDGLHPICAARLAHAAARVDGEDLVLLSGWARHPGRRSEASLMRDAWSGSHGRVVVDHDARTTLGNAKAAAQLAGRPEVDEVVVVTSRWHAPRAAVVFAAVLHRHRVRVRAESARTPFDPRLAGRELVAWALLAPQLLGELLREARRRRDADRSGVRAGA
jgi:hypothetical protein